MGAPTNKIVVNSLAGAKEENGDCSLREAIEAAAVNTAVDNCAARSLVSPDTITFNLNGTIFLNEPLIVGAGVTIQGNGQEETILDGQGITQVIQLNGNGRGHVELHDLTIQNGSAIDPIRGGGIYGDHHGHPLLLDGVTKRSNQGTLGGGIYIDEDGESLTHIIRNSIFIDNVGSRGSIPGIGGAVYWSSSCSSCDDHQFVIENSVLENNRA